MSVMEELELDFEKESDRLICTVNTNVNTSASRYCTLAQLIIPVAPTVEGQAPESPETGIYPLQRGEQEVKEEDAW